MTYRGLIFDIDGTAVPLGAMEAGENLQATINNNKDKIHLSAATGRSAEFARPILKSLGLTDPCIVLGGSAIVYPETFEVLWEKRMDSSQIGAISKVLKGFEADILACNRADQSSQPYPEALPNEPLLVVYALAMEPNSALSLIEEITSIEGVAAHSTPSWDQGKIDIHITHIEGTKEHGIHKLKEVLGLNSDELVGVGDSANDMPIFNAVGYKVAMGNASDELKNLADQVAPSLEENGLAFIIKQVAAS